MAWFLCEGNQKKQGRWLYLRAVHKLRYGSEPFIDTQMKKFGALVILLTGVYLSTFAVVDVSDDISAAIRAGSARELSRFMANTVTLTIEDDEDAFSREQAAQILKDFFTRNPPKAFTLMHKSAAKDGSQYAIGKFESGDKVYRTYFLLKKTGDSYTIDSLSFELDANPK